MQVNVHLPSGSGCSISLSPETPVSELKAAAQRHFQRRFLKLTASGRPLDLTASLSQVGLRDGDVVDALAQQVKLAATDSAFALHAQGGEVVTWGQPECGGDCTQAMEQLTAVQYLDCCWVGSLDFNFLGNKGVFSTKSPNS